MGSATARRTTSASLDATGWVLFLPYREASPLPLLTCTTFQEYQTSLGSASYFRSRCFQKACFFNDLSESTKGITELQGLGLLKRRFVVEKWVGHSSELVSNDPWGRLGRTLPPMKRIHRVDRTYGEDGDAHVVRMQGVDRYAGRIVHPLNLNQRGLWRSYNRYFN
jgi:hypothetical protein